MFDIDRKSTIFWDITACNPLSGNRRFGGTCRFHLCLPSAFTLVSCSAYSSTLKMEAIWSSETSVDFQRTTQRYIPEHSTLHNRRCENLKSYGSYGCFISDGPCNYRTSERVLTWYPVC
jgi:hypothetical protein